MTGNYASTGTDANGWLITIYLHLHKSGRFTLINAGSNYDGGGSIRAEGTWPERDNSVELSIDRSDWPTFPPRKRKVLIPDADGSFLIDGTRVRKE